MKTSLFLFLFLVSLYAEERPLYQEHFDTEKSGIFLPLTIDGKECSFLFDTGASFVVLDKSLRYLLAEPLTLKEAQEQTGLSFSNEEILTPNGTIALKMYKAISLRLGKLQVANRFPYILADLKRLWPFAGEKFCGILGSSFLHQFRWEIDFQDASIKAYIGAEPYKGVFSSSIPISWSGGKIPQVKLDLYGKEVYFDIDTGDNGSGRMLKENFLFLQERGQVIASRQEETITISALSRSTEFRFKNFVFAKMPYAKLVMQESRQNAIGLLFLRRHDLILDFPFNTLYMKAHKNFLDKQELDKSGLRVILQDEKLIVFSIRPEKGACIEGIQTGDEIISVNEKTNLSLHAIRKLLRSAEGTNLSLKTRRSSEVSTARIVLGKDPLE